MRITLLIASLWWGASLAAQPFAFTTGSGQAGSTGQVPSHKLATAQKVFQTLLRARGDYRLSPPTFSMTQKVGNMATFYPDQAHIELEEKAYDVCASFGKDSLSALAALLAHELTHYYENHNWSRHFVRENNQLETAHQLEHLEEGLKQETQADCLGGILAFSAGYEAYGIMPQLLRKLYRAYDLSDNLPGYPNLAERLQMVESAMSELKALLIVFETANRLTVLGEYADAALYYRHILQTYQSREIYNNAGVNATLAALYFVRPQDMPFVLPLELDPKSRLSGLKNDDKAKEEQLKSLLHFALEQFDRALALDEDYATAYLNKACIMLLKGEVDDAAYLLRKGKKKAAGTAHMLDFDLLEGVLAAVQGDSLAADRLWAQAGEKGSQWAKTNLQTLRKTPKPETALPKPAKGVEEIEQFQLEGYLQAPVIDREVKVAESVYSGHRQMQHSQLFVHFANKGKQYVVFHETLPDYNGKTLRGAQLKDPASKVLAAYGPPPRLVAHWGGMVWVYPEAKLYFRFAADEKLEAWGVYLHNSQ